MDTAAAIRSADDPDVIERFHAELELVEIIANQILQSFSENLEYEELLSAGREGLLEAARRYDPTRGVKFRSYANYRVRGSMIDSIRRSATLPRRAYERLVALEAVTLVTEGQAQYTLSTHWKAQISDDLTEDPFGPAEAEPALDEHLATMATAVWLAKVVAQHAVSWETSSVRDPEEEVAEAELWGKLRQAVNELPGPEAVVILRHYFQSERLEDIARDYNMDKSWASRLHTRAVARLMKRTARFR